MENEKQKEEEIEKRKLISQKHREKRRKQGEQWDQWKNEIRGKRGDERWDRRGKTDGRERAPGLMEKGEREGKGEGKDRGRRGKKERERQKRETRERQRERERGKIKLE